MLLLPGPDNCASQAAWFHVALRDRGLAQAGSIGLWSVQFWAFLCSHILYPKMVVVRDCFWYPFEPKKIAKKKVEEE